VLSSSLSSQRWWTSPLILWGQKHAKSFFLKGSGKSSALELSPTIVPGSQFMYFQKSCFFKTISSPHGAGVSKKSLPCSPLPPPIPSAQMKTNQQNQWQAEDNPHPFHNLSNHSPSNVIKSEGCEIPHERQLPSLALHWDCHSAYWSATLPPPVTAPPLVLGNA